MIKYSLRCLPSDHRFEGWFGSSADFDRQREGTLLECPVCGTSDVEKALMAPAIVKSRGSAPKQEAMKAISREWNEVARRAQDYVANNFENVGKRFPEEARKQHYGEAEAKPIYGEASPKEVRELKEEGVTVAPVPQPLTDASETKKKMN